MHHCASSLYTRELKVIVLYQPFQNRTIPRPAPPHLPPLSKVRCCRPKEFGRLPEGLPHHSSQNRTIPRPAPPHLPLLSKVRCCRPLDYRTAKTGGAVNGGAFPPFILTVDRLGWVCYLLTAIHSH